MRRIPIAIVSVVVTLGAWSIGSSISRAQCIPACANCVCWTFTDPDSSGSDSTIAYVGSTPNQEWGPAAAFMGAALTIGFHAEASQAGSWMENALEPPPSSPAERTNGAMLSARTTKGKSGYTVSMTGPPKQSLSISVLNKGKTVWTGKSPGGNVAVADEWPSFASAGADKRGYPTVGWAYGSTRQIHLSSSIAKGGTTVTGDQIRAVLEMKPAGEHSGILRLNCSPTVKSIKIQSYREGLFNLAVKPPAASR